MICQRVSLITWNNHFRSITFIYCTLRQILLCWGLERSLQNNDLIFECIRNKPPADNLQNAIVHLRVRFSDENSYDTWPTISNWENIRLRLLWVKAFFQNWFRYIFVKRYEGCEMVHLIVKSYIQYISIFLPQYLHEPSGQVFLVDPAGQKEEEESEHAAFKFRS